MEENSCKTLLECGFHGMSTAIVNATWTIVFVAK